MKVKPVEFMGDALDVLREFPSQVRRAAGFQLDRVQHVLEPDDWKPMTTVGAGVREIRIRDDAGAYRVIYMAKHGRCRIRLALFPEKNTAHQQE